MKLTIQFKDYLQALKDQSNRSLSINAMLEPFGIKDAPLTPDDFLLVGHALDALAEEFLEQEVVDALDVLRVVDDLGSSLTSSLGQILEVS